MSTFELNNGTAVIDREDHDGNALRRPYQYANRTQAQRAADKLRARGYAVRVCQPGFGPAFYLAVE